MAYEIPGFSFTLVAAADLSSSQFRFCTVDANGKAALPAAAAACLGVINNKPKINEAVTIVQSGISIVEAAGAVPLLSGGTPVKVDNTGRVVAQGGTGVIVGWALEAASGAGIQIAVLLSGAVA
jgi:Uncharacterized conserved protein (DUF2190)